MTVSAENKFLAVVAGGLFLASALCYLMWRVAGFERKDQRVEEIIGSIDQVYAKPQHDPNEVRHLVADLLLLKQSSSASEELFLHLSVSFFVAAMLVVCVDVAMRNMAQRETDKRTEEVNHAIWKALLKRFVPASITEEIEGILKSNVCRIRPQYVIRLLRDAYEDVPAGHIVVRRELSYRLKNLTPQAIPAYPIRVRMDSTLRANVRDSNGGAVSMPGMRTLMVAGETIENVRNLSEVLHNIVLKKMDADRECVPVYSCSEELLPTNGQATYIISVPCVGLEVSVINELRDEISITEVYLTGGWEDKLKRQTPEAWLCEAGVLPGTVLVVSWEHNTGHDANA